MILSISISPEKISRGGSGTRKLWPKNAHADSLVLSGSIRRPTVDFWPGSNRLYFRRSTRPYRKRSKNCDKKQLTSLKKSFVVRPKNDYEEKTPLLVFINPRSGGNQGRKVLAEFQYLLNPRQVFDLTQGGPIPALELYKRVPNLRILCCGGDGTCG